MEPFIEFHLKNGNNYCIKASNIRGILIDNQTIMEPPSVTVEVFDATDDAYWELEVVETMEEIRHKLYKIGVFIY